MVKIFHRTLRGGTVLRFVTSFTHAEIIQKELCELRLPAIIWDEEFPKEVRGGVWKDDNEQWRWFSK